MNPLERERQLLRAHLQEALGGSVFSHIPERFTAPAVFAVPGAPYLESGSTFDSFLANFEVWIIAPTGSNETVTNFIDQKLTAAVVALLEQGWGITGADEPFLYSVNNTHHLAVILRVSTGIRFNQQIN